MNNTTNKDSFKDIPFTLKTRIIEAAKLLPKAARSRFVRNTTRRASDFLKEHPRTFIYGTGGWVVGTVIDDILTFNLPVVNSAVSLTADLASDVGGVAGVLYGFCKDRSKAGESDRMARIFREEFHNAKA